MSRKSTGFFAKHSRSSAALISLGIHVVLMVVAISFVAVSVVQKKAPSFEAKTINRPRMELKKLQVPIKIRKKKMQAPKLRKNIVSRPTTKSLDIKLPELAGIKGGLGYLNDAGGLGEIGFNLDMNIFGGDKGSGNEFVGTFYDLKQTKRGKPTEMDEAGYYEVLEKFDSSWNINRLEDFFKAPKNKYCNSFMLPEMSAEAAPEAYGVADVVQPRHWVAYYKGLIAAPETGRYRFCGLGDDVLLVRINGRLVINASLTQGRVNDWDSTDKNNRKFPLAAGEMVIGSWFRLNKGRPVEMEVLFGECPGGVFFCQLLIEQEKKEYRRVVYGQETRPVLPVFKTTEIPEQLIPKMKIDPDVCTTDGPVFGILSN